MKPGIYRHYKGQFYFVIGTAFNANNESAKHGSSRQVVYIPLYSVAKDDAGESTHMAVRSEDEFSELVDGVPRFTFVTEMRAKP